MDCVWMLVWLVYLQTLFHQVTTEVTSNEACTAATTTIGSPSAFSVAVTGPDTLISFSYMVESPNYYFTCCGVITEWKVKVGTVGTIQFHVWRRKSTNVYEMIGENAFSITTTGEHTFAVDNPDSRITVQKGDYVGWHNQGNDMVMYKAAADFTDSSLDNFFRRINAGDMKPGDTYDWSTVEAYNDREYGLQVTVVASTAPTITLTSSSLSVPDYLSSGSPVTSFLFSDADTAENSSLTIYQKESSSLYSVDLASGKVTAGTSFRPQGTANLKYFVYDQCYKTAEATQTISVSTTNLVINNLDADFTVAESSTAQTLLHTLTVTEYSDQWYCYSGWSTLFPFMLKPLTTTSYGFYLIEHPGLDYENTPSYTSLTVTCVENRVSDTQTYTGNYNVYVTKNYPPTITNLDVSVTVDATTAVLGDTLYTVTATDAESDVVKFTTTCLGVQNAGAACPFTMIINGNIQVNTNLLFDTNNQYVLVVTATDSDTNTDTGTVVISITNTDNPITITSYPSTGLEILENQPLGTDLYTFTYEDLDSDAKAWSISYTDNRLTRHLTLDPDSGLLSTAFYTIDYEELGSTVQTATVLVGDVKSTATATFTISIVNENEAPRFEQDTYHIEANEGASGTQITDGTSLFTVIDVDAGDSHEYYLSCDSGSTTQHFYMTLASGAIAYQGAMDIDTSGTQTEYECTVTVVDAAGLNDTTSLYIHILNANEHTPEFTKADYTIYLAENALVGTSVLEVSAIDLDSSDDYDNEITYLLDQTGYGGTINFAINHKGVIYTAKSLTSLAASSTFKALSANLGALTGTTTITVLISSTTTAAATTTTDRNLDFYEDKWNYYWMLLTLGGLFCIILTIALVLARVCRLTRIEPWCYNLCCKQKPPRPRGFNEGGYDLATFGHKHVYTDEDDGIDGWLKRAQGRRTGHAYKADRPMSKGGPAPMVMESDGRYSSATMAGLYGDEESQRPLHELMRVNTPGGIPKAAGYRDPIQKKAIQPKWKGTHRNRGSILKKAPSSWNN